MSHPIEFIATDGPAGAAALPSAAARNRGDFGFAEALDAASAQARSVAEPLPPAAVAAYNILNLLNGKFPPPDSGAGFIFTEVTLQQEEI